LLRDLRSRESDSLEILSAKDSQITLLRGRLIESDEISRTKSLQYEQLQDHTDLSSSQSQALDSLQTRIRQLEQEHSNKIERLNDEKQQLIEQLNLTKQHLNDEHLQLYDQQQQTKHSKNLIHQLEQDMNEYKAKAQRILQTKDKLISKLKDIAQHRSSTPTIGDQNGSFK
jgi:chromosome segregation ATPase